jgi:uncharacterized membrane protein
MSYFVGRKRNPIEYDLKSIAGYLLLFGVLYAVSVLLPLESVAARLAVNTLLLAVYVAYFVKKDLPLKNIPFVNRFFK